MKLKTCFLGVLLCFIGLSSAFAADITWTNTSGGNWNVAGNWSPNQVPVAGDRALITTSGTYTVTLNSGATVSDVVVGGSSGAQTLAISASTVTITNLATFNANGVFSFTGGTINGGGSVTLNGVNNSWASGVLSGMTMTVASGAQLTFSSTSDHDIPGSILNNNGTIVRTGGNIRGGNGSVINNNGLWNEQSDYEFNNAYLGAASSFVNNGTYRKTGATGQTTFQGSFVFSNPGMVDYRTGSLYLAGGGAASGTFSNTTPSIIYFASDYTFSDGTVFAGTGLNRVWAGTSTMNGNIYSSNLELYTGNLAGTHTFIGSVNWIATYLGNSGTTTIPTNSTLTISTSNDHNMPNRTLINNGTIMRTSGNVRGGGGSSIINNALWNEQSDYEFNNAYGGAASTFVNNGTFRKTVATGQTTFQGSFIFNSSGLVDFQKGNLYIGGGGSASGTFTNVSPSIIYIATDYSVGDGTVFAGNGTIRISGGTTTLNGTIYTSNLELNGGSITGTQTFIGTMKWFSGNWFGPGSTIIPTNSTLTILSGSNHDLPGRYLTNNGTVVWADGYIRGGGNTDTIIQNNGLFLNQVDWVINKDYCCSGTFYFNNNGIFRKTAGTGTTTFVNNGVVFNNSGVVDVQSGTLTISCSGTTSGIFTNSGSGVINFDNGYTFNDGTMFVGGTTRLNGGTMTFNGNITVTNLEFRGATLAGTHTFNGTLNWMWGSWGTSGGTTISTNSTLTISTGNNHDLPGRTLVNNGTVLWVDGYIRGGGNTDTTIDNYGLWVNRVDWVINKDYCCSGAFNFNNYGIFRKELSGGTTTFVSNGAVFNNYGQVEVLSGTLSIQGGGTSSGTFSNSATAVINFGNSYTIADGVNLIGAGTYRFTGGTITLDGVVNIGYVEWSGATLAGSQTFNGTVNWINGYWGTSGTTTIGTNAILQISSGNYHDMPGRNLVNNGRVEWSSGYIRGGNTTHSIVNNGLWISTVPGYNINKDYSGGSFTLYNNGIFNVATNTTLFVGGAYLAGGGVFTNGPASLLEIHSGCDLQSGAAFTGSGTPRLANGNHTLNGNISCAYLEMTGGTLYGTNTFNGTFNWVYGSWGTTGTTTISSNGVLNISSGNSHDMPTRNLVNNGTVNWTAGYVRGGTSSHSIVNNGLWNSTVAGYGINKDYGSGNFVFSNNGTFRVSSGTTYFYSGAYPAGAGVFTNASGTVLELQSGADIQSGAVFTGAGITRLYGGNHTFTGNIYTENIQMTGGNLYGDHTFIGTFNWISGWWGTTGTTIIPPGSTLFISSGNYHEMPNRNLINNGTVNWSAGWLRGGNSTHAIYNNGLWISTVAGYAINKDWGGGSFNFNNYGTFHVASGTTYFYNGITPVGYGVFTNSSGTLLEFQSGCDFRDGAVVSGPGLMRFYNGNHVLNGNVYFQNAEMTGGNLYGDHNIGGTFNWIAGWWGTVSSTTIATNGTLLISSGNYHEMPTHTLVNNGTVSWTAGWLRGGTTVHAITNNGLWTSQVNGYAINKDWGNGSFTFYNNGTFKILTNTTYINNNAVLRNAGDVEVTFGTLQIDTTYTQTAGETRLLGGNLSSPQTVQLQGGVLSGTNTLSASLNNSGGDVNPGAPTGRLIVTGNYTQGASAALSVEVDGVLDPTKYDKLQVNGSATLNGAVNIDFLPSYCEAVNDTFTFLTFASRTGTFSATNTFGEAQLAVTYTSTNVFAQVTGLLQPTITQQPSSRTNNAGINATFTVGATGSCLTYQWKRGSSSTGTFTNLIDGPKFSGVNTPVLTVIDPTAADEKFYKVIVSNPVFPSGISSIAVKLTVRDPAINSQPVSQLVALGQTAVFSVVADGTTPLNYQWRKGPGGTNLVDGGNISGANSPTLTISNVDAGDYSTYKVLVNNSKGSVTSSNVSLSPMSAPVITQQPAGLTRPPLGNATFTVTATGAPINYQWQKNGVNIPGNARVLGTQSPTLTIKNLIQGLDDGDYTVLVFNDAGTNVSSVATLLVSNIPPTISIASPTNGSTFASIANIPFVINSFEPPDGTIDVDLIGNDGGILASFANVTSQINYTLANVSAGTYSFRARAVDNLGLVVTSSPVNVTVTGDCTLAPNGIVAWWRGENSGNDQYQNYNGIVTNGTTFTTGKVGQAFNLDGANDYISTTLDVQPSAMPNTTWMAWVMPTRLNYGGRQQIFSDDDGGFDRSVLIESSTPNFGVFTGFGVWQPVAATANEWQHIAVVFTPTNVFFYKNGVQYSMGSAPTGQGSTLKFQIGRNPGFGEYFQGRIDEVAVFSRALTSNEVSSVFAAGVYGKCSTPKLVATNLFGGAGDQFANGVTFSGNAAYIVGNDLRGTGNEGLIARYNINGTNAPVFAWTTNWPGLASDDNLNGIAVSAEGIYAVGDSYGRTLDTIGSKDNKGIVVKYSEGGATNGGVNGSIFDKQTPAAGAYSYGGSESLQGAVSVVEGTNTFVYVTGVGQNGLSNSRLFVSKVRRDGTNVWTVTDAGPNANTAYSAGRAILAFNGFIYVAGESNDSGSPKGVLKKYDSSGNLVWSSSAGTGRFNGVTVLGASIYTAGQSSMTNSDFTVARWNEAGQLIWSQTFDGGSDDVINAVVGLGNRVYAVGYSGSSDKNAVLLEIDAETGALLTRADFGGTGDDVANGITTDGTDLFVAGGTQNGANGSDVMLLRYKVAQPDIPLLVTTTTLPLAELNKSYTALLTASGGLSPYTWSLASGSLPPGMTLSTNGVISGASTSTNDYTFTVRVTDLSTPTKTNTKSLTLNVVLYNDAPVVNITSPANGALYGEPAGFTVIATANDVTGGVARVEFYQDNTVPLGTNASPPYQRSVSDLAAGSYAFTAVAYDVYGARSTSAPVNVRVNAAGTSGIDFEALDASAGDVSGATLSSYLSGFGVSVTNETSGSLLVVKNESRFNSGNSFDAPSGVNLFTQTGVHGKASYTVAFSTAQQTFSFTRARLLSTYGVNHPQWTATAYDSSGVELSTVSESAIVAYTNVPAKTFTLYGPNISWVRIQSDDRRSAAFTSPLIDDFLLSTVVGNQPPTVSISSPTNGASFTAPANVSVSADASDPDGVTQIDFYLGPILVSSVPTTNSANTTLRGLAPGSYGVKAVAKDTLGAVRSSSTVNFTVTATPGVSVINFDALDASLYNVGSSTLTSYLGDFGVTVDNVTRGGRLEAADFANLLGGNVVVPSSFNNVFSEFGVGGPATYTMHFAAPQQSVQFTRPQLRASGGVTSHPKWTAHAFNNSGEEVASVTEALIRTFGDVAAKTFTLTASNITSVRFDSDGKFVTAFGALVLDDLILNTNPVVSALSVNITAPTDGATFVGPTNIDVAADAANTAGFISRVEFYAGPALVGIASNAPYQITWEQALPGSYKLQAKVIDLTESAVFSAPVNVTIGPGAFTNIDVINFDSLATEAGSVTGTNLDNYLAGYGVTVTDLSAGTQMEAQSQANILGGLAIETTTTPNLFTQTGGTDKNSFTLHLDRVVQSFSFTRLKLNTTPYGISHPAWRATAYNAVGVELGSVSEDFIFSYTDVAPQQFTLSWPGIATVKFDSDNRNYASFKSLLIDDIVLTHPLGNQPPVIAITDPADGGLFFAPNLVTIAESVRPIVLTASAFDSDGAVTHVDFYNRRGLTLQQIGSVTSTNTQFTFNWTNASVGEYTLVAYAYDDQSASAQSIPVQVTVVPPPDAFGIVTQPRPQTVPSGTNVTLFVTTTEVGAPIHYQWMMRPGSEMADMPAVVLTNQTNATLILSNVTATNTGAYWVVATNSFGELDVSQTAQVTVIDAPLILVQPQGRAVTVGSDVSFDVTVAGAARGLSYQWLRNGNPIRGAVESSFTLTGVQPFDSGDYSVIVANDIGTVRSSVANLSVIVGSGGLQTADNFADRISINPLQGPVFAQNCSATSETGEPQHTGKTGGKSVWFTWRASFTGVISFTTQGSSFDTMLAVYTGTSVSSLTQVAANDDAGGQLTSTVTFNCVEGFDYEIAVDGFFGSCGNVVLSLPPGGYRALNAAGSEQIPVITASPTNQSVLLGGSVTLSVSAFSTSPLLYQWFYGDTPIPGATDSSFTITNFSDGNVGTYFAFVANDYGSTESERAEIQIASADVENYQRVAGQDKFALAPNSGVQASGFAPGKVPVGSVGTSRGYTTTQIFDTSSATKEAGEPAHCGEAGGKSEWFVYEAPTNGVMHVNTDGSSFNTVLAVYTGTGVDFESLVNVACDNSSSGNGGDRVRFNATQGTTYFIAVDGVGGVGGVVHLNVNLGDPPVINSAPLSATKKIGENVTFSVGAGGSTNLLYQWKFNGANIAGATGTSYTRSNIQAQHAGAYTVVVSNLVALVTNSPVAQLSIALPPNITVQPVNRTLLAGSNTTLNVTATGSAPLRYQWRLNGTNIVGKTNATLSLVSAQTTNAGDYTVVITNIVGSITSSVATVTVLVPLPKIVQPGPNAVSTTGTALFSGTAPTNARIAQILYRVNLTNDFVPAVGTTSWSATVPLTAGDNIVELKAVDASGFESALTNRAVFYSSYTLFKLLTSGNGEVMSASSGFGTPTNNAMLVVDKVYKLTAKAGTNWVFTNWTYSVAGGPTNLLQTNALVLNFVMQSNLTIIANFITNPLVRFQGVYNGLFAEAGGAAHHSAGFATMKVTPKFAVSGKLFLDGNAVPFGGKLRIDGTFDKVVSRYKVANKGDLLLTLSMDLAGGSDTITGTLSDPVDGWTSSILVDRRTWTTNVGETAVAYTNAYTTIVPGFANNALGPMGYGYGYGAVDIIGKIKMQGALGDGTIWKQSIFISKHGVWPLFAPLYTIPRTIVVNGVPKDIRETKGEIIGWVTLTNNAPAGTNNLAPLGDVVWIKTSDPAITNTTYTGGFTNETSLVSSRWLKPALGQRAMRFTNAVATLSEGDLAAPFNVPVLLSTNNALLPVLPLVNGFKPNFDFKKGLIKGAFNHPVLGTLKQPCSGVMLQDYNYGRGFFMTTNQSGIYQVNPAP